MTRYHRPADRVTERIVASFEDFEGWADGAPARHLRKRAITDPWEDERAAPVADETAGPATAVQDPKPVGVETPPVAPPEPPADPLARCPSCGCSLPDPRHLVSSSMLMNRTPKGA